MTSRYGEGRHEQRAGRLATLGANPGTTRITEVHERTNPLRRPTEPRACDPPDHPARAPPNVPSTGTPRRVLNLYFYSETLTFFSSVIFIARNPGKRRRCAGSEVNFIGFLWRRKEKALSTISNRFGLPE